MSIDPTHNVHRGLACLFTILLTVLSAQTVLAEPGAGSEHRAELSVSSGAVSIQTQREYVELSLVVQEPDGIVSRQKAEHTDGLSLGLVDDGNRRPDGLYSYELRGVDAEVGSVVLDSGFFSISHGAFVDPEVPEGGFDKEYLEENLYVDGSLCAGENCEDGDNFGYATVRIAEDNTRIVFDDATDTSQNPLYSANDWMLKANESSSGGAGLFSLVDCGTNGVNCENKDAQFTVEAGAPANSLYIDSVGDVGFGTSIPQVQLHVQANDTPTLRLAQDSSLGFLAQTWDVIGNEANFAIRDVTHSSALPFRIEPGAPGDSLTIEKTGEVGIGTWNPSATLDVRGDIAVTGTVDGRDVGSDGSTLDAHLADVANPHLVTAAQVGADPSGTAAAEATAAVAAHESAYNHGPLEAKRGRIWAGNFSGNPAMATATFNTPFPAGTNYIVLLTANTNSDSKVFKPTVRTQDTSGFTITLGGSSSSLNFVAFLAYPLN